MIDAIQSAASRVLAGPVSGIVGQVFTAIESAQKTEAQVNQIFSLAERGLATLAAPTLRPPTPVPIPYPLTAPVLNGLGDTLKGMSSTIQNVSETIAKASEGLPTITVPTPAPGPHVPEPVFANPFGAQLDATAERLGAKCDNWFNQAQSLFENSNLMMDIQGVLREADLLLRREDPAEQLRGKSLISNARSMAPDDLNLANALDMILKLCNSGSAEDQTEARHKLSETERSLGTNARRDTMQAQYMMTQARRMMSLMNQLMRILMSQQRSTMLLVR